MKIAIASDDGKTISPHFGKAEGFVIFEVHGQEVRSSGYRQNSFTGHALGIESHHREDRHKTIIEALRDCDVVISRGMGRRLYEDLKNAGINPLITDEDSVDKAIEMYMKGMLADNPEKSCKHKEERGCGSRDIDCGR
jgi:predicted Fe-Mo cluster-binding NifX family protein